MHGKNESEQRHVRDFAEQLRAQQPYLFGSPSAPARTTDPFDRAEARLATLAPRMNDAEVLLIQQAIELSRTQREEGNEESATTLGDALTYLEIIEEQGQP